MKKYKGTKVVSAEPMNEYDADYCVEEIEVERL